MPSRSYPGGNSVVSDQGNLGFVTAVSLITKASGTAQSGYVAESDVIVVTGANGSNTAITLPDPALTGYGVGDWYDFINSTTQACVIFPPSGGKINNGSTNASAALAASKSVRVYVTGVTSGATTFITMTGA